MPEFIRILPENVRFLPQSLTDFLYSAVEKSPASDMNVEDAIAYVESRRGDIFAVRQESKIVGAAFFMYGERRNEPIMDFAMLGGTGFSEWGDDMYEFAINWAKSNGYKAMWIMGRKGWGRRFPDLKPIGVIYELDLTSGDSIITT